MTLVVKKYLALIFFLFFTSCFGSKEVYFISGQTMGTTYSIKIASKSIDTMPLKEKVEEALKEVNRQMSTYIKTSEISQVNRAAKDEALEISLWFYDVLGYSLDLARKTNGSYDPTLGPLVNLWGFGPTGNKEVPPKEKIEEALAVVGHQRVKLSSKTEEVRGDKKRNVKKYFVKKDLDGVYVDLSSLAKGFGVDVLSELLVKEGYEDHLVEIGGELRASGKKFKEIWKVAVEKPTASGRDVQKVLPLKNMSIATSGDYRNFFNSGNKRYSHTLDVKTGEPVQHKLVSVSVLDPSCMKADALATALMSLGPEKAIKFTKAQNLAAYLIFEGVKGEVEVFESVKFLSLTGFKADLTKD